MRRRRVTRRTASVRLPVGRRGGTGRRGALKKRSRKRVRVRVPAPAPTDPKGTTMNLSLLEVAQLGQRLDRTLDCEIVEGELGVGPADSNRLTALRVFVNDHVMVQRGTVAEWNPVSQEKAAKVTVRLLSYLG